MRKVLAAILLTLFCCSLGSAQQISGSSGNGNVFSGQFINWTASQGGPYTQAAGVTNFTIMSPSGATPTQADLTSHRYHHHTQVAMNAAATRLWVASSSGLNNEDASGQMTVLFTSTDNGNTWSAPITALPPQDTMSDTTGNSSSRVGWSRAFVTVSGTLYYVSAVQSGSDATGLALVAVACNDDGTVGSPVLISTAAYAALACCATINYDAILGPQIFPNANILGVWGGSVVGAPPSAWTGWVGNFTEPATFKLDSLGNHFVRLWRLTVGTTTKIWAMLLSSSGTQISSISVTNIPNNPSQIAALRLSDGRIAVVLNPNDGTPRANMAIGLFDGATGNQLGVYYVRSNVPTAPVYPGINKLGGCAYFGLFQNGNTLWISYSEQKESVGISSVDLTQLNFVLKRDLDPGSNDNDPMWLEKAA